MGLAELIDGIRRAVVATVTQGPNAAMYRQPRGVFGEPNPYASGTDLLEVGLIDRFVTKYRLDPRIEKKFIDLITPIYTKLLLYAKENVNTGEYYLKFPDELGDTAETAVFDYVERQTGKRLDLAKLNRMFNYMHKIIVGIGDGTTVTENILRLLLFAGNEAVYDRKERFKEEEDRRRAEATLANALYDREQIAKRQRIERGGSPKELTPNPSSKSLLSPEPSDPDLKFGFLNETREAVGDYLLDLLSRRIERQAELAEKQSAAGNPALHGSFEDVTRFLEADSVEAIDDVMVQFYFGSFNLEFQIQLDRLANWTSLVQLNDPAEYVSGLLETVAQLRKRVDARKAAITNRPRAERSNPTQQMKAYNATLAELVHKLRQVFETAAIRKETLDRLLAIATDGQIRKHPAADAGKLREEIGFLASISQREDGGHRDLLVDFFMKDVLLQQQQNSTATMVNDLRKHTEDIRHRLGELANEAKQNEGRPVSLDPTPPLWTKLENAYRQIDQIVYAISYEGSPILDHEGSAEDIRQMMQIFTAPVETTTANPMGRLINGYTLEVVPFSGLPIFNRNGKVQYIFSRKSLETPDTSNMQISVPVTDLPEFIVNIGSSTKLSGLEESYEAAIQKSKAVAVKCPGVFPAVFGTVLFVKEADRLTGAQFKYYGVSTELIGPTLYDLYSTEELSAGWKSILKTSQLMRWKTEVVARKRAYTVYSSVLQYALNVLQSLERLTEAKLMVTTLKSKHVGADLRGNGVRLLRTRSVLDMSLSQTPDVSFTVPSGSSIDVKDLKLLKYIYNQLPEFRNDPTRMYKYSPAPELMVASEYYQQISERRLYHVGKLNERLLQQYNGILDHIERTIYGATGGKTFDEIKSDFVAMFGGTWGNNLEEMRTLIVQMVTNGIDQYPYENDYIDFEKVNVYSFGMLLNGLLNLDVDARNDVIRTTSPANRLFVALFEVVHACLHPSARNRPTLAEVRKRLTRAYNASLNRNGVLESDQVRYMQAGLVRDAAAIRRIAKHIDVQRIEAFDDD